jgi:D-beta-D-heptose 7-phosphate kinase/D-beta-D-heptose 1-phosphate adenosyltransferase
MKIVIVTGGYDPLHSGHIAYFKSAKELGDKLIAGVNSDAWLTRKKGRPFMPFNERMAIVENIQVVDQAIGFDDSDGSAKDAIVQVRKMYPDAEIIFANGGDRTAVNIPEMDIKDGNLTFKFGVGGENKANSSSWILQEWKAPKTERAWGYYRVLHDVPGELSAKVKELTVDPGASLSMQRHAERSEFWFVAEGEATVYTLDAGTDVELLGEFKQHQSLYIPRTSWHQLVNEGTVPLKLIEIQYGISCEEEDIERKNVKVTAVL